MKTPARLLLAFAATSLASIASAQSLTQVNTYSGYSNSVITFATVGGTATQTFTGVSAIQSLDFNFFATAGSQAGTFTATFGEWNGSSLVGGTTVSLGSFSVTSGDFATEPINGHSSSTYHKIFDLTGNTALQHPTYGYLNQPYNASKTYALQITQDSGTNAIGLGLNTTNPFVFGANNFGGNNDWVFNQIAVYAGDQPLVPVPEASTVAAIAGAVLVAGLVIVRTRQRRQLALAAAGSTAAPAAA